MATEFRQYDQHGFPVPPQFADLKYHDDQPPHSPTINLKTKRLVLIVLIMVLVVPAVFGPQLLTAGREMFARWFTSRAERKLMVGDLPGALADLNYAIYWSPEDLELKFLRAMWRNEISDLAGSLADWNDLIDQLKNPALPPPKHRSWLVDLAEVHSGRAWVLVRMGHAHEAIDDATEAVKLRPTPKNLNSRAYVRAIANTELLQGLDDIDKAITEIGPDTEEYATFLDTRGYLLHLLDRNEDALDDLTHAIDATEQQKRRLLQQQFRVDMRRLDADVKQKNADLAVMYHHRGLAQEKLGHGAQAQDDLRRGDQLGYDPAKGVF